MEQIKFFWSLAYYVWPPCIRTAEIFGFHDFRQRFPLGYLIASYKKSDLEKFLSRQGFEHAVLAWRDPGEVLSMRRVSDRIYQHHIRLFADGEIRAHYEYTPESHPWDHIFEACFRAETAFFKKLLKTYLATDEEKTVFSLSANA